MTTVDQILREPDCAAATGLSRTRRYELEKQGKFPKRIRLSARAHGWRASEVQAWIESRVSAQPNEAA